ncbi:phosphate binding protein [Apilactobacillus kunkeei DSM 12361 = ATCC 700308]|uniref:Phosphate-binding protein n=1 Tax=Apilactobacillus kunkeei DSM 12361 = ATCC 700308 TaxID=1423768 RepID=A0A0R1FUX9_9LACO|nr:Phosphate ABC superfamily ATP binding cassette transporter, binding protein [Apilactobacillus kunkeei DSM 12361 = ATCC 700308]KRK22850.1 phosphate binding protein [Apilactobacillus kunkeei DSM 12361 = ATCC 700308]
MIKMNKVLSIASVVLVSGSLLAACGSTSVSQASGDVSVVGSTALQPLVEQAAKDYQKDNSGVNISVQGGGSGTGLSQVQSKSVSIGNSDVFAEKQSGIDASKLKDNKVAVVGMAPVVNKGVGVKNISLENLKKIFTGKITNWKELGGKNQKIDVINRVKGSGTRATFESNVLNGASAIQTQEQDSNGAVKKIVSSTPGAISYLAFSFIDSSLQPLSIDNVAPTDKNVETNAWKIWSYEHMYTPKKADKNATKFIKYVESGKVQKALVNKLGYISISDMKVTKDSNNKIVK